MDIKDLAARVAVHTSGLLTTPQVEGILAEWQRHGALDAESDPASLAIAAIAEDGWYAEQDRLDRESILAWMDSLPADFPGR